MKFRSDWIARFDIWQVFPSLGLPMPKDGDNGYQEYEMPDTIYKKYNFRYVKGSPACVGVLFMEGEWWEL
jgi:hypothetical protein